MIYIYTFTQGQLREYVGELMPMDRRGYSIRIPGEEIKRFYMVGECGEVRGHKVWFEEPSKDKAISAFIEAKEKRRADLKKQIGSLEEEIKTLRRMGE